MSVAGQAHDLWRVIRNAPTVDPADLLAAVEAECDKPDPDVRTRLLIRDSLRALNGHWGPSMLDTRLSSNARRLRDEIERQDLGDRGFPTLARRLMNRTRSNDILEMLEELGRATREPSKLVIGGSTALILRDLIARATDDIDAVNEVPANLRTQYELIDRLADRYGLRLAHFQSHYLPKGWERRIHSLGVFGQLTVFLIDPVDIFVGKVFSNREKDLDDLRMLKRVLDWPTIVDRLETTTALLRAVPGSIEAAEHNWAVLTTGQPLPAVR